MNGLFMIIGKEMTLRIPLPTIANIVATKIMNGELVVTLKVADPMKPTGTLGK
mgnify:CR=1 FL=1